jgi:hypothetical protein
VQKAEDTFMWVSLVCGRLDTVDRDKALATIEELPPSLHPFYNRILHQLNQGEPIAAEGCIRLLKVMLLVYRPLKLEEINSMTGLFSDNIATEALIGRCASFVRNRGANFRLGLVSQNERIEVDYSKMPEQLLWEVLDVIKTSGDGEWKVATSPGKFVIIGGSMGVDVSFERMKASGLEIPWYYLPGDDEPWF